MKTEYELLEFLEKQLERTNYWLSFAEGKNGALLALNGVMIAVIVQVFEKLSIIDILEIKISIIFFIFSIVLCLYSFRPNTERESNEKNTCKDGEDLNLLFYKDISKIDKGSDYIKLIKAKYFLQAEITESTALAVDMAKEIVINSKIASKKYKLFMGALIFDVLALLMILVSIFAKFCE